MGCRWFWSISAQTSAYAHWSCPSDQLTRCPLPLHHTPHTPHTPAHHPPPHSHPLTHTLSPYYHHPTPAPPRRSTNIVSSNHSEQLSSPSADKYTSPPPKPPQFVTWVSINTTVNKTIPHVLLGRFARVLYRDSPRF